MDALQAILTRRAVRKFARQPVALEQLQKIVDAGRHAMSALNRQSWNFIIVRNPETLGRLGTLIAHGTYIAEAPAAIAVLKFDADRFAEVDCSHAVQNMADAAWAMGLGTCRPGLDDQREVKALLGVPQEWSVFTVMPIGHPDPNNPPQGRGLKPRDDSVHYERFAKHQT